MFEVYVRIIITRWKALKQRYFTDDEVKIILNSPANSLKEFTNSIELLKAENRKKQNVSEEIGMTGRISILTWSFD